MLRTLATRSGVFQKRVPFRAFCAGAHARQQPKQQVEEQGREDDISKLNEVLRESERQRQQEQFNPDIQLPHRIKDIPSIKEKVSRTYQKRQIESAPPADDGL